MKNKKLEEIIESEIREIVLSASHTKSAPITNKKSKIEEIIEEEIEFLLMEQHPGDDFARERWYRKACAEKNRLPKGEECDARQMSDWRRDHGPYSWLLGPPTRTVEKWIEMGEIAPSDFDVILKLEVERRAQLEKDWAMAKSGAGMDDEAEK